MCCWTCFPHLIKLHLHNDNKGYLHNHVVHPSIHPKLLVYMFLAHCIDKWDVVVLCTNKTHVLQNTICFVLYYAVESSPNCFFACFNLFVKHFFLHLSPSLSCSLSLSLSDTLNTHMNSCSLCLSFYWIPVGWWKYNCHQSIYLSSAHTRRRTHLNAQLQDTHKYARTHKYTQVTHMPSW